MQFEKFLRFQILDEHNASFHMSGKGFPNSNTKVIKNSESETVVLELFIHFLHRIAEKGRANSSPPPARYSAAAREEARSRRGGRRGGRFKKIGRELPI